MQQLLVKFLICPRCKKELSLKIKKREGKEIKEGTLICTRCHRHYSIVNFIPRFVKVDQYVGNFSFEWQRHRTTQLDSYNHNHISRNTFLAKTGFDPKELKGKLVLDVGCGMGRFSEIAADYGAQVIGIDLSYAVEAARQNLKKRPNCQFIQADVFHLPFKSNSFDFIFSIGVLHHTPDTKKAFLALPRLLKPRGEIAIWVYGANTFRPYVHFGRFWRILTPHLPKKLLYYFSFFSVPLYFTYKIPFFGTLLNLLIPYSTDPNWRWRILDTFDWYSPKYQWMHTYPEIIGWYEQAKLKVLKVLPYEASVLGQKP
ncbi:MAG: hypothetical protein COV79_02965 [Parcubacteria group bacterium CG11_big_fil_rev_8_21_14_0_20_41_14]|nr:MAG: hypothetical protein COV79_02965 [Parcubacteria group bacterium CG11_big_fil_rev_8_21_14_0_20_41_14]PIR57157.1 MAG: hypothetical protein COU72_02410 [Parcubacteria group bacterium CG10_big_fil_rev_8_21_14_0_10_41_35]